MPKFFGFYFRFEAGEFLPSQRAELTARWRCQRASRCFPSYECPPSLSRKTAHVEKLGGHRHRHLWRWGQEGKVAGGLLRVGRIPALNT